MDELESKIIEILQRGTSLRAAKIAALLEVEKREVNHYLYSSLKHLVIQDSDYRWSLKTNQIGNIQHPPTQPQNFQNQLSKLTRQDNQYRFTKTEIKQDGQLKPPTPQTQSSKPVKQSNSYEVVKKELAQASSEEKVKILENAFSQDRFTELEDEQINALQSILEQAKREVSIANSAYKQGKLSFWKTHPLAIAVVSIALTLSTLFVISQLKPNSTYQTSPTIPQNR